MKNIWRICKINLGETFSRSGNNTKKKARVSGGWAYLLILAVAAYMIFSFYNTGSVIAASFKAAGELPVMLYVPYYMSFILVLSLSIFQMPAYLFGSKDYDMLAALPIKSSHIIAGKLLPLYLTNLGYSLAFCIGLFAAYIEASGDGVLFCIKAFVCVLFIPLLPMAIAALLTWLCERIAAKFNAQNVFRLISSVFVMLALMFVMFYITGGSFANVPASKQIYTSIGSVLVTARFFAEGLAQGNILHMLWSILISLAAGVIFVVLFGRGYKSMTSGRMAAGKSRGYTANDLKTGTVRSALVKKEISYFFSNTNYALNSGIGVVLFTIAAIALAIFGGKLLGGMGVPPEAIAAAVAAAGASFTTMMSAVTAPSISLEGPTLWLIKSIPVKTREIFLAKLWSAIIIVLPLTVIDGLVICIALGAGIFDTLALVLYLVSLCFFSQLFGLSIGIKHANVTWLNDIVPIKQGSAIMLTVLLGMLIGFALIAAILFLSISFGAFIPVTLGFAVIMAVISALLWNSICKKGVKRFAALYR